MPLRNKLVWSVIAGTLLATPLAAETGSTIVCRTVLPFGSIVGNHETYQMWIRLNPDGSGDVLQRIAERVDPNTLPLSPPSDVTVTHTATVRANGSVFSLGFAGRSGALDLFFDRDQRTAGTLRTPPTPCAAS